MELVLVRVLIDGLQKRIYLYTEAFKLNVVEFTEKTNSIGLQTDS